MSDETTLLPCPFCGGEAEIIEADYGMYLTGYAIYCRKCCLKLGVTGRLGETYEWSPVFDTEAEAIAAWNTRAYLNPDGLPMGLTISDDGNLLNWRGENYVKQGTLGEQPAKSGADALSRRARDMARNIQGNLGRCLYRRKDVAEMEEVSETLMELANELNAELGSGTCEVECFDDGVDEGLDGEWFSYSPPTWYLSCGHTAQGTEKPNFCPVCGKAVKR